MSDHMGKITINNGISRDGQKGLPESPSDQVSAWYLFGVNRPVLTLMLGVALLVLLASGLSSLQKDTRADAFLQPDNPALIYKNKVKALFGLSDPLVVAIENRSPQGIYNSATLALVQSLTDRFNELEWINAERTVSLATENHIQGSDEGLDVRGFMDIANESSLQALQQAIADFPLYDGMLVSQDGVMTLIVLELYEDAQAQFAYDAVNNIVDSLEADNKLDDDTKIYVAGEGAVLGYLGRYIDQDASRLNPLAGLIITIMLVVAFRRVFPALLGNVVIAASVLMTLGFMAHSGVSFFVITNAMPVILIGMAVADSIHILSHYYETQANDPKGEAKHWVEQAVREMFRPITLTSLTTMAGFLGLTVSSYMPPFEYFGLFTAFGVMVAWLYSVFFLPAAMVLCKPKVSKRWVALAQNHEHDSFSKLTLALGRIAMVKPKFTLTVFVGLMVMGGVLATQLQVNENRINTFDPSEPIYQADKAINAHLEGTNTLDIVIQTPKVEGLFEIDTLTKMEALQNYAHSLPHVNGSSSIVDYIKQMHKSLNEGDESFYVLPDDPTLIAQYFLLYSASAEPTDFEEEMDYNYQLANIRLNLDTAEFIQTRFIIENLQRYIDENFSSTSDGAQATLSGRVYVNYHWIKDLGTSHFIGVLVSLLFVAGVSGLLFRSFSAGVITTLPVLCSILMVYAAMAMIGIDLGIGTSMFASVAIGLGIDFSIHTLDRIKASVASGVTDVKQILVQLYQSTGRALLFNYLAIAFGFGVLISSQVVPLTYFGTIVVLSVSMSFIAAMMLVPVLVTVFKPRFIFQANGVALPQEKAQLKEQEENKEQEESEQVKPVAHGRFMVSLLPLVMTFITALVATIAMLGVTTQTSFADEAGLALAKKIHQVDEGQYVTSHLKMVLTDRNGNTRVRETKSFRKYFGEEKKTLMLYLQPANVRGTGFLTFDYPELNVDDDQWLYLPALRKVRRISASDRGDYFMGTDFTYEDIKQNDRFSLSDYDFELSGQEAVTVDGETVQTEVLLATPKSEKIAQELGYGKLKIRVHPDHFVVVKTEYWDVKGKLIKTAWVSDIALVDGIWTRHKRKVLNHVTGHTSEFEFSQLDYQTDIPNRVFSKQALTQGI